MTTPAFTSEALNTYKVNCNLISDPQTKILSVVKPTVQCAFEEQTIGCPAIHAVYRILLRSSSTCEPSDPPLTVVL